MASRIAATGVIEPGEDRRPVALVAAALRQHRIQHGAVLERGVHALAMEWHDGVRRIAQQQDGTAGPGVGVDGAEMALWMVAELCGQIRDQRGGRGEFAVEELLHRGITVQRVESGIAGVRQKQRGGEAAVRIRQGNQHEAVSRPDMQRIGPQGVLAVARRNVQFLVVVLQRLFVDGDMAGAGETAAQRRAGAIGGDGDRIVQRRGAPRCGYRAGSVCRAPGPLRCRWSRSAAAPAAAAPRPRSGLRLSAARPTE